MSPKFLLFLSIVNSILGLSILFPILSPLGRELGLSEVQIGWLSTGYALMQFLSSPLWGRYSEKVGRKPVLLTGVLGFGVGFALFGATVELGLSRRITGEPLFIALLGSRLIGGLLSSATMPTAQAYMADVSERENRTSAMALVGAAFGLGVVFGPAIGAGLSHFGLLTPIYVSAAIGGLNGLFVWLMLPESRKRAHLGEFAPTVSSLFQVWPILAVAFVVTLASVSMEQTVAFLFQDVLRLDSGSAARFVGLALVGYGVAAVLSQGVMVRRVKWSPLTLMMVGLPVALLGFVGLVLASKYGQLSLSIALQGFGQGLIMPGISAALSLGVAESQQGEVAGLNSAVQALGRTVGPVLGTSLYAYHARAPYQFSVILLLLVLVAVSFSRDLRRRVSAP